MRPRLEMEKVKRRKHRSKILKRITLLGVVIAAAVLIYLWNSNSNSYKPSNESIESNDSIGSSDSIGHDERDYSDAGNNNGENDQKEPPDTGLESDQQKVKLTFVGDIMFSDKVNLLVQEHGFDYPYVHVKDYLQYADLTIANLETPITERGEPEEKSYAYRSSPQVLPALVDSGIDIVNLANNHILDHGLIGMLDTFDHLDQAGLQYVGAGNDDEEAYSPVIVEKNGVKIAFFGFSQVVPEIWWKADKNHPGVAETYDYTRPVEAIESIRAEVDLVVIIAHWGTERTDTPHKQQAEMAHRYIDAGADLVIGGHPHVLQSIEHYNNKWIAYSLGNFIFTTNNEPLTWETVILQATCSKDGECEIQLIPVISKWAQPKPMDADKAEALLNRIRDISIDTEIDQDGTVRKSNF